jgi:inosine/xanthosine triphosphate pyrophosphatase family protein
MKVLFATGNSGKFIEVKEKFTGFGIDVALLDDEYQHLVLFREYIQLMYTKHWETKES